MTLSLSVLEYIFVHCLFFFFSSRRRHTRFDCDWSSDVCSSDLGIIMDERERSAADKADNLLPALGSCIPLEIAGAVFPVVSLSGYEGELEVRDFLDRKSVV